MAERYTRTARATAFCGSPGFFPPEMVTARDYDPFRVDIWSVGCVAVELLLGREWFSTHWMPNSKLTDAPRKFEAGVVASLDRLDADLAAAGCSELCAEFVKSALALNPNDRPSIEDLAATPWIARSPHLVRISRENSSSTLDLAAEAPSSGAMAAVVTPDANYATIAPSPPNDGPPEPAARRPKPPSVAPAARPVSASTSSGSMSDPTAGVP
jgi:serine/threonine protein kinase